MMKYILIVVTILNIHSFILMGVDKKKSIMGAYRISEKKLLLSSWFFGSIGFLLGMKVFRHKTLKWQFKVTGILSLLLQLSLFILAIIKFDLIPWL